MAKFAEFAAWWAGLVLVWLATLSSFSFAELGAAAVVAVPGAVAARAGRVAAGQRWRVDVRWVRWLWFVPWAVVHDTVGVLRLAVGGIGLGMIASTRFGCLGVPGGRRWRRWWCRPRRGRLWWMRMVGGWWCIGYRCGRPA